MRNASGLRNNDKAALMVVTFRRLTNYSRQPLLVTLISTQRRLRRWASSYIVGASESVCPSNKSVLLTYYQH
jgi:glucan phosphorylase